MFFTTCDITVSGVPYRAGDELPADVNGGCLESMLRIGQAIESDAPPAMPDAVTEPDDVDLTRLNKDNLIALAAERAVPLTGEETKKQLVEKLQTPAPQPTNDA